jgi:drug/metabolite transporter (DMT)-like permease
VRYLGEFYSLLCALLWATAVILFRKSGEQAPPVALNLFKGTIALVALVPMMFLLGSGAAFSGHTVADWVRLVVSGIIGIGVGDSLFFASLNRLGAGRSAIVNCLYSPLVVLWSALLLAEPVGWALCVGMVLMVGAILLEANPFSAKPAVGDPREQRVGIMLGLGAMAMMAFGIVLAKPVLDHSDVLWAAVVRVAGGTAFVALQSLRPSYHAAVRRTFVPSALWKITVPAALLGTCLAMIVWLAGMKYTSASVASVLNQTSTLIVPLLAVPLLREPLGKRKLVAVALGFAGAVVVTLWGRG